MPQKEDIAALKFFATDYTDFHGLNTKGSWLATFCISLNKI
jgi:hypothetical protein